MAQFQSQGQWENESQSVPEQILDENTNEHGENVLKQKSSNKKILLLILLLFSLAVVGIAAVYMKGRSVEGIWVRQADDNYGAEGMTVEVKKVGSLYEGKVIQGSDDSTKFRSGQVKWFQLKKVGFGVYEGYNLSEEEETQTFYYDGTVSTWTVHAGGKSLTLESPGASAGAHQLWLKEKR